MIQNMMLPRHENPAATIGWDSAATLNLILAICPRNLGEWPRLVEIRLVLPLVVHIQEAFADVGFVYLAALLQCQLVGGVWGGSGYSR